VTDPSSPRREELDAAYLERRQTWDAKPIEPAVSPPPTPKPSHTKRLISVPERHASTVAAIAARVVTRWGQVENVAAALTAPTMRAAGSRDGGRSSEHPDPTANIALHKAHQDYDDLREAVHAWLEQGKWIEARQVQYLREHPDFVQQKSDDLKGLCTEAGCDFNQERRGKCWSHYRAELEAERLAEMGEAV
jgi:hypothetical protein